MTAGAAACACYGDDVEALQKAGASLQVILFAGAAILAAGAIEMNAIHQWAAAHEGIEGENAKIIVDSATIPAGTFFSLYLVAAYLPVAYALRRRGFTLARNVKDYLGAPVNRTLAAEIKWLTDRGLISSVSAQFASAVALLSPVLLAGPLKALGSIYG